MRTRLASPRSRKRPRVWKVPPNISNPRVPFAIDNVIKKLSRRVKWKITSPLVFGRLALKNAILKAKAESQHQPDFWIASNKRIATFASRAHTATDRTIRALAPRASSADMLSRPLLAARTKKGRQNLRALRESSLADARILWLVRDVLKRISEDAMLRQKAIAEVRQNVGDAQKRVFVLTLAEAWCSLSVRGQRFQPKTTLSSILSEQPGSMPGKPRTKIFHARCDQLAQL